METFRKINRSSRTQWAVLALLWGFALVLNFLTHYVEDDFVYMFQLVTKERLRSVWDIFPSMAIHAERVNGRLVCHGLDQLFLLWPKAVFNVANAFVTAGIVYAMYRLSLGKGERGAVLLATLALAVWRFVPAFGQTFLWQTGAFNYSWAVLWGLLFVRPFAVRFLYDEKPLGTLWERIVFPVLAVPMGSYTEITSLVSLLMAAAFLLLGRAVKKQSLRTWLWIPVAMGAAGYALLLMCPAELAVKMGGARLDLLLENFTNATLMLKKYGSVLLGVWAAAMALAVFAGCRRERVWGSAVFAAGAVAANYMMSAGSYYPERCFCTTAILLVLAIAVLVPELAGRGHAALCAVAAAVLVTSAFFPLVEGVHDIWTTHVAVTMRQQSIEAQKEAGETDLLVPRVTAKTQYCAFWGLWDISNQTDFWVNRNVAAYYGVNSIRSP